MSSVSTRLCREDNGVYYVDVGYNIDHFAIGNFVLILCETNLRCARLLTTSAATSWFNIDAQFLSIFAMRISYDHLVDTGSLGCGTVEDKSILFDAEQRWYRLIRLIDQFLPGDFDGIV
jgi:hypothetical protein